jgi:hypothetical protein
MMIQNGRRNLRLTKKPIDKKKRNKELRNFALIMSGMIILFFAIVIPWLWGHKMMFAWPHIVEKWPSVSTYWPFDMAIWPFIVGAILSFFGLVMPVILAPFFKLWMWLGEGLGWINSRIILTVVFYLLIMPMGVVMRLFGSDPMKRKLNKDDSYRIIRSGAVPSKKHMERPF